MISPAAALGLATEARFAAAALFANLREAFKV
jgi:hypothetical protein